MSSRTFQGPLSRPRFAVAVAIGIYPVITSLLYVLGPVFGSWPTWQKTLALVPLIVAAMVWGIIPAVHRWLRPWIHPASAR
jgi:antibiotic biosynthesis monooxygenase (ABM) superfamily enzyme